MITLEYINDFGWEYYGKYKSIAMETLQPNVILTDKIVIDLLNNMNIHDGHFIVQMFPDNNRTKFMVYGQVED